MRMSQQIYTLREIKQAFRAARFTVERVIPVRGGLPAKGRVAIVGRKG